jgi:nitroreductase
MKTTELFNRVKNELNLFRFALDDTLRFYRHAGGFGGRSTHLLSKISIGAHVLERGLALPAPRPQFGQGELADLGRNIRKYLALGGDIRAAELQAARGALTAYHDWHIEVSSPVPVIVRETLGLLPCVAQAEDQHAGVSEVSRDAAIAGRRRSIRIYDQAPVSRETALAAVKYGQSAPSVCNRQSGRVHLFLTKERVAQVMACHVGCGGFRESIPAVAIITSDLRTFHSVKERYQGWIDGGLLLMQFLNGLHAVGLGGCPLNWSVTPDRDIELRRVAGIPEHERIIALVSFGNLPEVVRYANSPRLPVESVCAIDASPKGVTS